MYRRNIDFTHESKGMFEPPSIIKSMLEASAMNHAMMAVGVRILKKLRNLTDTLNPVERALDRYLFEEGGDMDIPEFTKEYAVVEFQRNIREEVTEDELRDPQIDHFIWATAQNLKAMLDSLYNTPTYLEEYRVYDTEQPRYLYVAIRVMAPSD